MKKLLALCILAVSGMVHAAEIPTDNPYTTFYKEYKNLKHWTDNIKWSNVFNIQDYATSSLTWDDAYLAARNALVADGGGVLFFPALPATALGADSFYIFQNNLELVSNVVLRGETPSTYATNPDNSFSSATVLRFPKYEGALGVGSVSGTDNSSAFRKIFLKNNSGENVGVVNMEINRARIEFNPSWSLQDGFSTFQPSPSTVVKNVIVFGVRSNNVAQPDPFVPAITQEGWQRWPWRFAANVLVNVTENAVVCNNRFNDLTNNINRPVSTDNYLQPGYKFTGTTTEEPNGSDLQFDYLAHYTVLVNRLKKTGDFSVEGFLSNSTPETEPVAFAKGIDVSDNWIYKTQRPGIQANGLGITIRNNVIRDKESKVVYVSPAGITAANISVPPTYECRGIDFGGWGCRVENNDIEVYRMNIQLQKFSEDGEGIAMKGDGGSNTTAKDILIRGNKVVSSPVFEQKGRMNGFERIFAAEFITIENNDFGNMPLLLDGQSDGSESCKIYHTQQNNTIRNNTNIAPGVSIGTGIRARASKGGANNIITGNTGSGPIEASCHYTVTGNTGFTYNPATCVPIVSCAGFCLPKVSLLGDSIVRAASKDESRTIKFLTNLTQTYTGGTQTFTNCFPKFSDVNLYIGDEKVATLLPNFSTPNNGLSFSGDTAVYTFTPSDTGVFKIYLTVQAKQANDTLTVNSQVLTYAVSLPVEDVINARDSIVPCSKNPNQDRCSEVNPAIDKGINISNDMLLFPNPTAGMVYLQVKTDATETGNVRIFDQLGRVLYITEVFKSGILLKELNVSSLQAGMYFVEYSSGRQKGVKILVKE